MFQSRGNAGKEWVTEPVQAKKSFMAITLELNSKWAGVEQKASKESGLKKEKCVSDKKCACVLISPVYKVVKACCSLGTAMSLA